MRSTPTTAFVESAGARLRVERYGRGEPVTVFAHGIAASIAETRVLASGVRGTRVFYAARGHPGSVAAAGARFGYSELAADLDSVASDAAATRALGVSLGAAALIRLLAARPDRFERVVFLLPAVLDRQRTDASRSWSEELAAALETGGVDRVTDVLTAPLPDLPDARRYARTRARELVGSDLPRLLGGIAGRVPVADRSVLARVRAPALVIGQRGDAVHPAAVVEELAAALPDARLELLPDATRWTGGRERLRELISTFLTP